MGKRLERGGGGGKGSRALEACEQRASMARVAQQRW